MKKIRKFLKLAALTVSAAILTQSIPYIVSSAEDDSIIIEFESGVLDDCEESKPIKWEQVDEDAEGNPCDMTGWHGDSYVYIDRKDSSVTVKATVPEAGFYSLQINYIQCFGTPHKIQYLLVNGESEGEICFPFNSGKGWELMDAGYVRLEKGENEIQIKSYWGYTFLDYIKLSPAPEYISKLTPTQSLCNPNATKEAKNLYAYLTSVYGNNILAGQQEYCGSHNYNKDALISQGKPIDYLVDNEAEFEYIEEVTGKQPAVRGIDFLFYNTTAPYFDDAPERVIAWYKDKGGIPTVTYHWNVPTNGPDSKDTAFYVESTGNTPFTTFSITKALTEGTWEHDKINADIELLAEQFKKIQDAGVPVIFRPLHEAEGAWFWWGAKGPEACKKLYWYLWDKLTNEYGLNNLIWTWTSSTYASSLEWYPGDEYVDLIGCDKYNAINNDIPNTSAVAATFYSLVAQTKGQKMVCMSENDTIPSLENLESSKAAWLYFCPWYQRYLTGLNSPEELAKIYKSDYCITLDELPDWNTYSPDIPDTPAPTKPVTTTSSQKETTTAVSETTAAVTVTTTSAGITTDAVTTIINSETTLPVSEITSGSVTSTSATNITVTETAALSATGSTAATADTAVSETQTPTSITDETEPGQTLPVTGGAAVPDGVKATMYGDVNIDKTVNVADVVSINLFLLNQVKNDLTDEGKANADCIKDGVINASDSTIIMNYVAELINLSQLGQ